MSKTRLGNILLPLFATILLITAWHYAIIFFDPPRYLFPPPAAVAIALERGLIQGRFWPDIQATGTALICGYVIGCSIAFLFAAILSEFSPLERALMPIIVALQSIPKVALAPILIVWFGFGIESKIVMVALICFFPCFVNALTGLKSYSPDLRDLYRAFNASRLQILLGVKLPSAAGHIFAGLQISIVMALLGAVVAEFLGAKRGLGAVIEASSLSFDVATMFASIVTLAIMGVVCSQIVLYLYRRIVFWERRQSTSVTAT